jgi:translocation and assembly module TamB
MSANLTAQNSSIVLKDFHAEDTGGHVLTGKGTLNYSSEKALHYQAEFNGNNLALFHHPNLQGALSCHIELTGDSASGQIKGKVQSDRTEIYLPSRFVSSVPELNVVRTIPPQKGSAAQTDSSTAYAIMLDVILEAANQVFIRGWGGDAELQGNLHLTGTMANPEIAGKLTTLRGRYEEFGKQFKITQGELLFEGDIPPSPFLNITAATQAGDVEVRPILSGPLLTPSLKVESTPSLPQDEALSVLLFGKDSGKISPFQAVQLANSLRKLSGHGGSDFDPIGRIRKLVGVDDISVNSGGENGTDTSVGVGKHLGENVYIGVERGADAASGKARIEVEVTPSISVESGTGATGDTSVGVNWKHDY